MKIFPNFIQKHLKYSRLKEYRPDTAVYVEILKQRVSQPFVKNNRLSDEIRWAALFCSVDEFNQFVLLNKPGINCRNINQFFDYYGIDKHKGDLKQREATYGRN